MTPYYDNSGVALYLGEAFDCLRELPSESVNCCITSPPYFGLRDYGTAEWTGGLPDCDHAYNHGTQGATGQCADRTFTVQCVYKNACGKCGAQRIDRQLGLERTYPEYIARLVEILGEVRRVLRDDGTLWLNLGDSYANDGKWGGHTGGKHAAALHNSPIGRNKKYTGFKPKDLMGIPWRVAFTLQDAGWYLRSDIIWAKPAPMPESVMDRPTRSHEYIFLLAKSEKYFYDSDAIKEPSVSGHTSGNGYKREARLTFSDSNGARGSNEPWVPGGKNATQERQYSGRRMVENVARARAEGADHDSPFGDTRNKRDVWTVNTDPFPEAHFATFPPALILPCVLAGCPVGGTVLDPFFGAGTTGLVAKENGRKAVGIELNEDYCKISTRRLEQEVFAF